MKELLEAAVRGKAHEWGCISVTELIFSPELFKTCATNACGHYNTSWTCPPAVGSLEKQRAKILLYKNAFVFTTKYNLEDSFDFEGMTKAGEIHAGLTLEVREKLGKEFPLYGAGSCPCCRIYAGAQACAFPDPCRFPDKMISSIEAAGINVTDLSRSAGVKYNNGANTVTYFSMALFN
jgi:predicted metal-binding protein